MELKSLQNGTDVRGVAVENPERKLTLTADKVYRIAGGFCDWLKEKTNKENPVISVGTDSRVSADEFRKTIIASLEKKGAKVLNCKMATTPAMYMSTMIEGYEADGAIMVTASHMPYFYNGLKFFTKKAGLEKNELAEVLEIAEKDTEHNLNGEELKSSAKEMNLIDDYAKIICSKIRKGTNGDENSKPFEGMKIIVDAGNGAGGFFAEKVLEELGADTEGSQFLNPDGTFPNHIPNPENKEAMESICSAVVKNNADLGIIFDTDVDRAALVGKDGQSVNKNALIALISTIILEEHPNTYIVTDSVTSNGLAKFIAEKGGVHHRFKRGYKNVINESIRLNEEGKESHLAIETSGHAAIKENYFLDDGSYLIAKILIKAANMKKEGKNIMDLISTLEEPLEEAEKRININVEDFKPYALDIIEKLSDYVKEVEGWEEVKNNYEGIRVNALNEDEKGWFLLRVSLHEPLLALNIESDVEGGTDRIYSTLDKFLRNFDLAL